jgi:shikimate 5-dehydrogenase
MTELTKKLSRRNFLLTLGAGGAATAAAVVATKSGTTQPTPVNKDKRATRGYQASEHVNNYYRTAKV